MLPLRKQSHVRDLVSYLRSVKQIQATYSNNYEHTLKINCMSYLKRLFLYISTFLNLSGDTICEMF